MPTPGCSSGQVRMWEAPQPPLPSTWMLLRRAQLGGRAPHAHLVCTKAPGVPRAELGLTGVEATTADPQPGFHLHKRPAGGHTHTGL